MSSGARMDQILSEWTKLGNNCDQAMLLKLLTDVRKNLEWPIHKDNVTKLRSTGFLKKIISTLKIAEKRVVDVALSILGNSCLDPKCANDVVNKYSILSHLEEVFKRHPTDDSINSRAFRIIGNLCQRVDQLGSVILEKEPHIYVHLAEFLEHCATSSPAAEEEKDGKKVKDAKKNTSGHVSDGTVTMVLRAVRELLNQNTFKALTTQYKVLAGVGMVLIKYGTLWQETKNHSDILMNVIKVLQGYVRYRYHSVLVELKSTEKGDAVEVLCKILMVAPKQIVKILYGFMTISMLKSDLPMPQLFNNLIDAMEADFEAGEFNDVTEECLRGLCTLLDHPGNRNSERCGKSVKFLVETLKHLTLDSDQKIDCCTLIVGTLAKCEYNKRLIVEQIECDVIKVIAEKLKDLMSSTEVFDYETLLESHVGSKASRKRCVPDTDDDEEEAIRKKRRRRRRRSSLRLFMPPPSGQEGEISDCDMSIASASSPMSGLSPASSPNPHSSGQHPVFSDDDPTSTSDSDDYSPVCSDAENEEEPMAADPSSLGDCAMSSRSVGERFLIEDYNAEGFEPLPEWEGEFPTPPPSSSSGLIHNNKVKLFQQIVTLISVYANANDRALRLHLIKLANTELLLGLIRGNTTFDTSHHHPSPSRPLACVTKLVVRIVSYFECFFPLLQTDFVPVVYELGGNYAHTVLCNNSKSQFLMIMGVLSKFTTLGESDMGRGTLAHMLLRGDNAVRQQLVLVMPYIIRDKLLLTKLMLNCGGLEILLKLLQEEDPSLRERSIKAISILASTRLHIVNPQIVKVLNPEHIRDAARPQPVDVPNTVTFKLDDGSYLNANRWLLTQKSDFFNSLLNGSFKESNEDQVALHQVAYKSLRMLLKIMGCDKPHNNSTINNKSPMAYVRKNLSTYLDCIGLCDRYLLPNYCVFMSDFVTKFRLSSDTVPKIYRWSVESRTNFLRVECVAFALVATMHHAERFEMFDSLFGLGHTEELMDDIKMLILRHLRLG